MQKPEVVRDDLGAVLGEEVHPLPRPDLPVTTGGIVVAPVVLVALLALAEGLAEVPVEGRVALQVLKWRGGGGGLLAYECHFVTLQQ